MSTNFPTNNHISPSEGNFNFYDIGSNNHEDSADVQSTSQIPSGSTTNISFQGNPIDEHINLGQPSTSNLFGEDLLVHKRSWAKDSTCKQGHIISLT